MWVCRRRARQCTSVVLQEPQVIVRCLGHGLVTVRRTGLIAAQTFRNLGCNVVGSAGSDDKVEMIQKIGIAVFYVHCSTATPYSCSKAERILV